MGAFLSGLLGAAGQDIEKQSDRKYQEKRQERMDRMRILELAASNPNTRPDALPNIFGELDDLAKDAGYKSQNKGIKNPFSQMGKMVQHILTRRQQQQQQQGQRDQAQRDVQGAPGVTARPAMQIAPQGASQGQPAQGAPTTPPMPQSRFGWFYKPGEQERQRAEIGREEDSKNFSLWYARGKEIGLTNPRDLAEWAASKGTKLPSQGSLGATKQWVKRPGADEPELAFVNKNSPSGYVDVDGQPIPDAKAVATPTQERLYSAVQGYYMYWRGKGLGDAEAKAKAGEDFRRNQGERLGRLEQQASIDAALSGIGLGPGLREAPKAVKPSANGVTSRVTQPAAPGTVSRETTRGITTPMPPSRVAPQRSVGPSAVTALLRPSLNPREAEDVQYYLSTITGGAKSVPKAAQVRVQNGQRALAKITGMDPMSLAAELSELPALAKQLSETVQRAGAIQRLNNTIDRHGTILEDVAKGVAQTDSPFLNRPVREWKRKAVGSPELKRFEVALNELQREYAYLTAGGAQSRAMLPVHTSESMDKILSDDSTLAEVIASVDQIRTGARTEEAAMKKTQEDIKESMRSGKIGQAAGAPMGSAPTGTTRRKVWDERTQTFEDR